MAVDRSRIGFVYETSQNPRLRQEAAVRRAGAGEIYYDHASLIAARARGGDTILVEDICLLARLKSPDNPVPVRDLWRNIEALEEKVSAVGDYTVTIIELRTGKELHASEKQRREMLDLAAKKISGGRRRLSSDDASEMGKKGARKRTWLPLELQIIEKHWYDRRHKRNAIAARAATREGREVLKDRHWSVTPLQCWRAMEVLRGKGNGGSGRPTH